MTEMEAKRQNGQLTNNSSASKRMSVIVSFHIEQGKVGGGNGRLVGRYLRS